MTRLPVCVGNSALLVVGTLVLGLLGSRAARAQDSPEPASPPAEAADAATVGSAQPEAAASVPDAPASAPSAPAYVAPAALEAAWLELGKLQLRQQTVWKEQTDVNLGWPAVAIAVGTPMFGIMLPLGALFVAVSNEGGDDDGTGHLGNALVACGIIGLVGLVSGTITLARARAKRRRSSAETRSLALRRSALEDIIEADWRAAPAPHVAPEAVAAAWQDVHEIRKREGALWRQQAEAKPGLGTALVGLGIPAFGLLVPLGAVYVARANSDAESGPIDLQTRRSGATLIGVGAVGFAALAAGTYMLLKLRRKRMQRDDEIRSLEERRSLLESIIEADWRSRRGAVAP